MAEDKQIISLDYEVFGKVTGVFFRKYTVKAGKQFGLRGFCMNTKHDTVLGQMQGPPAAVREMKSWLSTVGSPNCQIDRAEFRNEKIVENYTLDPDFKVNH